MANEVIRHARAYSPFFYPNKGGNASDFHGIFTLNPSVSVTKDDIYVIGKKDKCAVDKDTPESSVSFDQYERGEIDTYLTLANLSAEPVGGITLTDFSTGLVDVGLYGREEFNGALEDTEYYPQTAVASISLDLTDPESFIQRSFELTGDEFCLLTDDNKALIRRQDTATVTGNHIIDATVLDPAPVINPNDSTYILRLDKTAGGVTTTLTLGTDYTYNDGSTEITVITSTIGDEYDVYYSAGDFGTPGDPTTVDACTGDLLKVENVTVLISDGTTELELSGIDCLSSLTINATLNRIDENCIGSSKRLLREIEDTPVTVDISARVKRATIEKAFMGELGNTHGISCASLFNDNVQVTVKVYTDSTKSTFAIGYQVSDLSFTNRDLDISANEFASLDYSLESDNLIITAVEGNL